MIASIEKDEKKLNSFMNTLQGHSKAVLCSVLFLPSMSEKNSTQIKYLITGSSSTEEKQLKGEFGIWDLKTKKCIKMQHGHSKAISALAIVNRCKNMTSDYLITGSEDGSIIVWKYQTDLSKLQPFELLHTLDGPVDEQYINSISVYIPPEFYQDEVYEGSNLSRCLFVSASSDTKAIVWDFEKIITDKKKSTIITQSKESPMIGKLGEMFNKVDEGGERASNISQKTTNNIENRDDNKSSKIKSQPTLLVEAASQNINNRIFPTVEEDNNKVNSKSSSENKEEIKHTDGILCVVIYIPKRKCVGKCDKCNCMPLIVTSSWDKTIIIWNLKNLEGLISLKGHTKAVSSVFIFDPQPVYPEENVTYHRKNHSEEYHGPGGSSPILVSGSKDATIIIWDLLEHIKINKLPIKKETLSQKIENVEFGNNFYKILSKNDKIIESGHTAEIKSIYVFDASANSPQIVSCDINSHIIFWDLLSGHKIRSIDCSYFFPDLQSIEITSVFIEYEQNNEDFKLISCFKTDSDNLVLWDFSTTRQSYDQSYERIDHENVTIIKIHDPKDGINNPISIVADIKGCIEVWDIVENQKLLELESHPARVNYIAINPIPQSSGSSGKSYQLHIAACDGKNNIVLRKIEVSNKKATEIVESRRIFYLKDFFYTIHFVSVPHLNSSSTTTFLVKGGGIYRNITTKLWNLKKFINLPESSNSFDHKIQENDSDKNFNMYLKTPDLELGADDGHSNIVRCIVSYIPSNPDEKLVFMVTSSYDKSAIVWKLYFDDQGKLSYERVHTLSGHTDKVFTICIFREYIITGSFDKKVIIWSMSSGKCIKELTDNPDSVTSIDVLDQSDSIPKPLLVTSGIGKLILIIELDINKESIETNVLKKLERHEDRVCSLAVYPVYVYNPLTLVYDQRKSDRENQRNILVSGGDDKSLMIWRDFFRVSKTMPSKEMIRKEFNSDLESEDNWPSMRKMTKRYDIALWIENSNLFYDVMMTLKEKGKIRENNKQQKVLDFFKTFQNILRKMIYYTNNYTKKNPFPFKSLIRCAIVKVENNQVLKIIIDCLIESINRDIEDPLTQRLYHPSYFIDCNDILFLGENYPSLFIYFISKIKLIKSSYILSNTLKDQKIHDSLRIIVSSCTYNWKTDLWNNIIFNRRRYHILNIFNYFQPSEKEKQVVSYYLPFVNPASREMLNAFVDISYNEGDYAIFNGEVGKIVVKYLWEKTLFSHLIQSILYLFYVVLYSYLIYKFEFLMHYGKWRGYDVANALNGVLLFLTIYYGMLEFAQIYAEHDDNRKFNYRTTSKDENKWFFLDYKFWRTLIDHFKIVWNFNDIIIVAFVMTGTIIRIRENSNKNGIANNPTYQPALSPKKDSYFPTSYPTMENTINYPEIDTIRIVYAVGTIFVYFKILYFLRPFSSFGPLVSIILQIVQDILAFLIILLIMVCAFAQVFWLLNENSPLSPKFGSSIWHSYLYTFVYMMGNVDPDADFSGSVSYPLNAVILIFFMLLMILLMLNLLIAIMNNSYGRVREKGLAQWRLEQGYVMLEDVWIPVLKYCIRKLTDWLPFTADFLPSLQDEPFIYVLKYASDSSELISENQLFDTEMEDKEKESQNIKMDNEINFESPVKTKINPNIIATDLKDINNKTLFNESVDDKLDKLLKIVETENVKQNQKLNELEEYIKSIEINKASSGLRRKIVKRYK